MSASADRNPYARPRQAGPILATLIGHLEDVPVDDDGLMTIRLNREGLLEQLRDAAADAAAVRDAAVTAHGFCADVGESSLSADAVGRTVRRTLEVGLEGVARTPEVAR